MGWTNLHSASMKGWSNLQVLMNQGANSKALTSGTTPGDYGSTNDSAVNTGTNDAEEFWSWDESIGSTEQDGGIAEDKLVDFGDDADEDNSWAWNEEVEGPKKNGRPSKSQGMNGSASAKQKATPDRQKAAKDEQDGWTNLNSWENDEGWGESEAWSNEDWMSSKPAAKSSVKTAKVGKKAD